MSTKQNVRSPEINTKQLTGGSAGLTGDELYKYKAKKYYIKTQQKLKEIMLNGGQCPAGYEMYLKPYPK